MNNGTARLGGRTIADACPRCGRSDGSHVGYHEDAELPIKRGDRVRLRAGAKIWTTHPTKRNVVNKLNRVIKVYSMDGGMSRHVRYNDDGSSVYEHIMNPGVCWVGTGGYWHHADLADVELVTPVVPDDPAG